MLPAPKDWTKALEQSIDVGVIYFDFMKAFDKVPLDKLIVKLIETGVHPGITNQHYTNNTNKNSVFIWVYINLTFFIIRYFYTFIEMFLFKR